MFSFKRGQIIKTLKVRNFASATAFDLAVIGAGPGGYVAAIKAAQLGMKVACIEKRATLGGTCLNVGCIPSKALLNASHYYHLANHSFSKFGINLEKCSLDLQKMQLAKNNSVKSLTGGIEMLFRKNKVEWLKGHAELKSATEISVKTKEKSTEITAKNVIIATGSESRFLPGIDVDEKNVVSSTGALCFDKVPDRLVVIGAGVIGLEMGSVWSRLGSKVTVVEFLDRIAPSMDFGLAKDFTKLLKKQGLNFKFSTALKKVIKKEEEIELELSDAKSGKSSKMACDKVLVAVGRKPLIENLGLEQIGIKIENGMIKTDTNCQTNIKNIFAIGDVTKGPQLAHKAEEEGIAVVEKIAGHVSHLNYDAIPSVVYTSPEVASVGKTEEELKKNGVEFKKGVFPFLANSRAKAVDDYEGYVKLLSEKTSGKLLGAHIIGEQAGDLIQECCLAINYGGSAEDIARTCHAHPTRSEAIKEAALANIDKPIHM